MGEQKNIPELRFPGFDGEWVQKRLGDIFSISAGGDIQQENVSHTKTEIFKYPIYANAEKDKGLYGYADIYKVEEGVVTVAGRGVNIGIAHARNHKFYPIVRLLVLRPKNSEDIYFYEYQINKINLFKESTGVPQLTAPQVSNYKIFYPLISEQQKIASFFTAIDKKISQLKQKKTLLEQYKKGVMQKIFSQEIRFRDENGQEFPKWEKKRLGELLIESNDKTSESNQYRILSSTTKGIYNQDEYFNQDIASKNNTGYKILKINQLVFSPQNLWLGNINVNTEFEIGIVSPSYKIFSFNSQYTSVKFCKYFLTIPKMMFEYEQASEQGASVVRRNLSMSSFFGINIHLPSLSEQMKIASFLSAIDTKINHTQTQIEDAQLWKKGLLQKMFV